MLLFIDEPRNIKIVRQTAENGSREPLGRIKKQQLAIPEDLLPKLGASDVEEIESALDLVTDGEVCRVKAAVAAFPGTVREVLAYYKDTATPAEQRWILGALLEGLRVVRRFEREHGGA
jgi:hypothetical protein